MAQSTAICFVLLGLSLALHKTGRVGLAQAIAVVPAALGFFAVLGYLFGVSSLYSVARSASMAVHTGFGLLVAGLAVLGLRADRGHMAVVSGNSAGGRLARRLLPIAIVVPPALGWIAITLLGRQTIDAPFALAMVATVMSLLGAVGVWIEASNLSELDVQRAGTVAALHRVRAAESRQAALAVELEAINRHREAILHSALDAFIGLDSDGRIMSWNPAAERLYGWSAAEAVGARHRRAAHRLRRRRPTGRRAGRRPVPRAGQPPPGGRIHRRLQGRLEGRGRIADLEPGRRRDPQLHRARA